MNTSKEYMTILQAIVCDRFANPLAEIDTSFERGRITEPERRRLSYHATIRCLEAAGITSAQVKAMFGR